MKFLKAALLFLAIACTSDDPKLGKMLTRPLITGASVSADYKSVSPGKKLAIRYTDSTNIKTIAFPGRAGRETVAAISDADLSDRTIVIAIDLFFWDSAQSAVEPSTHALNDLIARVTKKKIPIVLAEIPELKPGSQPGRPALNEAITKACANYSDCYLLPYDQIHRQVLRDGFLLIRDHKYTLSELLPDGLHLSDVAGDEFADRIEALLKSH